MTRRQTNFITFATVNLLWSLTVCWNASRQIISFDVVILISVGLVIGTAILTGLWRALIGAFCSVQLAGLILGPIRNGSEIFDSVWILLCAIVGFICGAIWDASVGRAGKAGVSHLL
jgi:hypothetical protein